jgi:DNA-directed RNA polymerase subunit RPC12/RpoP
LKLVTIRQQVKFEVKNKYRCPHCQKNNVTARVINHSYGYDESDHTFSIDCEFCGKEIRAKGRNVFHEASIPAHLICRCGRHFLFHLERDVKLVKFLPIGTPYIQCAYCRQRIILYTPLTPARFYADLLAQKIVWFCIRQKRLLRRAFSFCGVK